MLNGPAVPIRGAFATWISAGTLMATLSALIWMPRSVRLEGPSVFNIPFQRQQLRDQIPQLLADGKLGVVENKLTEALSRTPDDAPLMILLAAIQLERERPEESLSNVLKAIEANVDLRILQKQRGLVALLSGEPDSDELLADLMKRNQRRNWKLEADLDRAAAQPILGRVALVGEKNVYWDSSFGALVGLFRVDDSAKQERLPICSGLGSAGDLLRQWSESGTAAGNLGDLYDNFDRDHSNMDYSLFPQLSRIEYTQPVRERSLNVGLQRIFLYNQVVFGNSSTAYTTGPLWRSQGRLMLTDPIGQRQMVHQYRNNHLYVYPEHRDYDPGHNRQGGRGYGDLFPANTPYVLISQGSSGSDRGFLKAIAATLSAFRPDVKSRLIDEGLLMPVVQRIFRRSRKGIDSEDDYLSGKAHPPVFDAKSIDLEAMVRRAHDLEIDSLPPLSRIRILDESLGVPGRDYFDSVPSERLFDTEFAVSRIAKSRDYWRTMVVSAEHSFDVNGQALQWHWVILQGDPERIRLTPLNDESSRMRVEIGYHPRRPIAPGSSMESNRVDIGVFVSNTQHVSPPAFISLNYLDNEIRDYDKQFRIRIIDYAHPEQSRNYVDPTYAPRIEWRDEYRYDQSGDLKGWERVRGDVRTLFQANGQRIVRNSEGTETSLSVRYQRKVRSDGTTVIQESLVPAPE